jgi:hypothetical protein
VCVCVRACVRACVFARMCDNSLVLGCAPISTRVQPERFEMQKPAAVEIEWRGSVWRGVVVGELGVLTTEKGSTYAGGVTDGMPDRRGVIQLSNGDRRHCELAAGKNHGYREDHWAHGAVGYWRFKHGEEVHSAYVDNSGTCQYDYKSCDTNHAGLVALKAAAQKATVRCNPAPAARLATARCGSVMRLRMLRYAVAFAGDAAMSARAHSRTPVWFLCVSLRACVSRTQDCDCVHARVRVHSECV